MKSARLLFIASGASLLLFLVAVGLHEYLYTFDPYSWASPGIESDRSRDLWLHRRDLYRATGIISLALTFTFGGAALVVRRIKTKNPGNATLEH